MYNVLNMLKSVIKITAYELKSLINEDINKAVRYGLKSLNLIPVKVLLDCFGVYVNQFQTHYVFT